MTSSSSLSLDAAALARAVAVASAVPDPEIPVLTLGDLGVIRRIHADGPTLIAEVSPTYLGCPAVLAIELAVEAALRAEGFDAVRIVRQMVPAWSTDDITPEGRAKLEAYGIAAPQRRGKGALLFGADDVACPRCRSHDTERVSEFGSTPCKAHWRCRACREPFDYFKCV
jgi:ring-1,2-phenylacetyl-CoA epoxidase subunit PaaD